MSIQTYALIDNLPLPVITPSGAGYTQSFTDAMTGEVWIANSGAFSGAWMKARDWLHATVWRAAALNMPTTSAIIQFDTTSADPFYMTGNGPTLSPNYGFAVPIPGWYRAYAALSVTVAVAGTYIQGNLMQNNATSWSSDNWFSTRASGGLFFRSHALMYLAAGDIVNLHAYNSQGYACGTTNKNCRMELSYLGTG